MHNMKSSIIAALLAIAHACAGTANAADDDPASAAARAGAMKWLSGAPTIHVAYTASTRHDPPADRIAARTDKYRGADLRRTEARAGSFDYSDGIARSDERAVSTTWDGGRPHWPTTSRHAVSRTSTRLEQLWWPVIGSSGPRAGQIDHPGEIPLVSLPRRSTSASSRHGPGRRPMRST